MVFGDVRWVRAGDIGRGRGRIMGTVRAGLVLALVLALALGAALGGCGRDKGAGQAGANPPASGQPTPPAGASPSDAKGDAGGLPALNDLLARGKQVKSLSYDYAITSGGQTVSGKMWISGNKIRTEAVVQGQKMVNILDGDQKVAYSYQPNQKVAIKFDYSRYVKDNQSESPNTPTDFSQRIDPNVAKILGTQNYEGAPCLVVSIEEPGKEPLKMYVNQEHGIPVRVETNGPQGKVLIEYKNLKVGPISEDMFRIPPGVRVNDLSQTMK